MSERIDLKALERKAYTSYHQDGIFDIILGLAIIFFGLTLLPLLEESMTYLWGGTFIVWFISYGVAKKSITVPRMGYVEFSPSRRYRLVFLFSLLVIVNVVIFAFMMFGLSVAAVLFLNQYGLLVVATVGGGLFAVFGWATQIYRLFGYGAITFLAFSAAHVFVLPITYPIIAIGIALAGLGFVLLYQFLRKYPKTRESEELFEEWNNELEGDPK
ncbi:MAG: hypothetical protein ACFE9D_08490 [Promethearchaeota archaeon]